MELMYQNVFNTQRKREGGRKGERERGRERWRVVHWKGGCTHYGKVVDLNPTGHFEWLSETTLL